MFLTPSPKLPKKSFTGDMSTESPNPGLLIGSPMGLVGRVGAADGAAGNAFPKP